VIKIVPHTADVSADTKVMGDDHEPYSASTLGVPADIMAAVREGFGLILPEFDHRQTEWETYVSHPHRNV
jgi:hypothetical protein